MSADRDAALARVMEQRRRGRERPMAIRVLVAGAGLLLAAAAAPLVVLLPELGVPLLLVALRLLAVEFDRAARAYAWVVWRWEQVRAWFRSAPGPVRSLVVVLLVLVALGLLWLLQHALA